MEQKTILAVDDEVHILDLLEYNLESSGYKILRAESGEEALEILKQKEVDLILLDLMLAGIDGIEVLKRIRAHEKLQNLLVIMLTAKNDEISKVVGLELGADDYLGKPFGINELQARIKALFRRTSGSFRKVGTGEAGNIMIDKTSRVVSVDGEMIELSLKEFELLYLLIKNCGRVFTREELLEKVWGYDYMGETRTIDVHIRNLRKKIEKDDTHPEHIKTVRGVGYKFV